MSYKEQISEKIVCEEVLHPIALHHVGEEADWDSPGEGRENAGHRARPLLSFGHDDNLRECSDELVPLKIVATIPTAFEFGVERGEASP